ncbi:MAG TPA: ABC transporter ATP-binding protein, partial [Candidatus Polarisedimenticolaceae bacterium]|nr:ABC transporter ATP-binding protein [Candidatus Polarisedimenticolaceae bacterium]
LSCLGGILSPTSGEITFGDQAVTGLTGKALADYRRDTVGIVFQAFNLVASLSALENVMVPLRAAGVSRRDAKERAATLLTQVGLQERMAHRPGDLSGGQQQRVAVARAMARRPALLLADEPTGNLDSATGKQIIELLVGMNRRLGATLVLVTHDTALAAHADRVVTLRDGRVVSDE